MDWICTSFEHFFHLGTYLKFHLLWSLVFQLPLYLITYGFSVSSEALSLLVPFRVGTVLLNLGYTVAQTLPDEGRGRE